MAFGVNIYYMFWEEGEARGVFKNNQEKNHFDLFIYLNHVTIFIMTEISKNKDPDKKF